jgi:outer membrane lipopolysaccharide assembly protein LptE/RlpB
MKPTIRRRCPEAIHPSAGSPGPVVRAVLAGLAAALALSTWGCGYALVGRGTNIPEDIRTVYLSPLANRTQRQQLDQFVTEAIADELVKRRRFEVVSERSKADADLSGAVVGFGLTPITFDDQGRATEYEISITAQVAFKRVPGDEVVWQADNYVFRETYEVDTSEAGFLDREETAIRDAAGRFAETMVSDLLEGF